MKLRLARLFGRSLTTRLVTIVALALFPLVLIAWINAAAEYSRQISDAQQLLLQRAKVVAADQDAQLRGARELLATLAELISDTPFSAADACAALLQYAIARRPEYLRATRFDTDGRAVCSSGPALNGLDGIRLERAVAGAIKAGFSLTGPIHIGAAGRNVVLAAYPLRADNGAVQGALIIDLAWDQIGEALTRSLLPPGTVIALVPGPGEVQQLGADPDAAADAAANLTAILPDFAALQRVDGAQILRGPERTWAIAPFGAKSMFIALGQRRQVLNRQPNQQLLAGLGLPALIWLVAVVTAWLAAERLILRWVHQVRELASSIAMGQPVGAQRRFANAPVEMQDLAESLGQMMETIQARNAELREALDNRETLIREIHHRVKNNLQIIASLLNLQMRNVRDGAARDVMTSIRGRINSLALIHRSLYETDELQRVELRGFLELLAAQMSDFLDAASRHIVVTVDMPPITVPAEAAVTIALLVTEALTNAFNHAFAGRSRGRISIRVEVGDSGASVLTIEDDGIGAGGEGAGTQNERSANLGHQLMLGYARQLGGSMQMTQDGGTSLRIELPQLDRTPHLRIRQRA